MTHAIARPDLGSHASRKREYFQRSEIPQLQESLELRSMSASMVKDIARRSREVLGSASWFASDSALLLDCARLHGQASLGHLTLWAGPANTQVHVALGDATVAVDREPRLEADAVTDWIDGWCSALAARDEETLQRLSKIDDDTHRAAPARVDEYQYAWKRAIRALVTGKNECAPALEEARRLWSQRSIADADAAATDACAFHLAEAIIRNDKERCNQSLQMALEAHRKFWSKGDNYLSPYGWVALQPLGLACVAFDRGVSIEVESPYLPRHLIARQFVSPSPLRLPASSPSEAGAAPAAGTVTRQGLTAEPEQIRRNVVAKERQLAFLAGEVFARIKLEPDGYVRVALQRKPLASFDFVYEKSEADIVLVDTLAGSQPLEVIEVAGAREVVQGTRSYVLYVVNGMRRFAPELATRIEAALNRGTLRYFEVRQPIAESGALGEIEIRKFALN